MAAAKKLSGNIKSSDAESLWAESRSIREWSTERMAELTGTINALERRVENLETRNQDLLREKRDLLDTIERLGAELAESRITNHKLHEELLESKKRVYELEQEVANEGSS